MIVYLSNGGTRTAFEDKFADFDIVRKSILRLAPNVIFETSSARKADFVVIPNNAKELKNLPKKTRVKHLDDFLNMLRLAQSPNNAPPKQSNLFWSNLQKAKQDTPTPKEDRWWDIYSMLPQQPSKMESSKNVKTFNPPSIDSYWSEWINSTKSEDLFPSIHEKKTKESSPTMLQPRRKIRPIDLNASTTLSTPPPPIPQFSFSKIDAQPVIAKQSSETTCDASKFSCTELVQLLKQKVPQDMELTPSAMQHKIRDALGNIDDVIVCKLAKMILSDVKAQEQKSKKTKLDHKRTSKKSKSDENDEMSLNDDTDDDNIDEMRRVQQDTETEIDRVWNESWETFNTTEHTEEEYDEDLEELLDFLTDEVERIMEVAQQKPKLAFLQGLAIDIIENRGDYDTPEDVKSAALDLVVHWEHARDKARWSEEKLTPVQKEFTKRMEKIVQRSKLTTAAQRKQLFIDLATTIQDEFDIHKNINVFRSQNFDSSLTSDIESKTGLAYADIFKSVKKLWDKYLP